MQIVSDSSVLVRTQQNDKNEWKWYSFPINDLKNLMISSSDLCGVSPNESTLLIHHLNRLWFLDIVKETPIGTHGYPDDCKIYRLFWITDDIAYIVTSAGLLMFQPSDTDSLTKITDIDDLIDEEFIYNVQLDEKSGYYVMQMRKNKETRIQYGNIASINWTVKDGSAACLFTPNNAFLKDNTCISYAEQDGDSGRFIFHTEVLKGDSELNTARPFSLSPESGTPLFIHCDPVSCLAVLATDRGHLLLFDALNGMLIGSTEQSQEIIAIRGHSEGGFLFLGHQSCQVTRCSIEPSAAIATYRTLADATMEPFHLACRLGLPDTNFEDIRELLDALFFNNTKKCKETLMKAVGKLNAANTKSFKCLIHQTRTIASIKNCIGSHFSMGETTDWLAVIHQWCEDYCNQPWNEEEFLCFDEDGGVDIDATLDMLVQEKREIREVELFQSMKPMMPDPFERAQVIMKLSKRKQQRDEMTYHKIAVEMKENDVHVGDEYWKAIMEEAFESEKVRKVGEQRIRRYMY